MPRSFFPFSRFQTSAVTAKILPRCKDEACLVRRKRGCNLVLNDHFEHILNHFGQPTGYGPLPTDAQLAAYHDIVPTSLMEFWKECGFGLVLDGYFQFCNPRIYQPIVNQIFEGDKDFDPKLICPIGFSAF